jgi:hypothetical protein
MSEASSWYNSHRQAPAMIHAGVIERPRDYGQLIKVVDEELGMTGNSVRLSVVVIDLERGRVRAGGDVYRLALVWG